MSKLVSTSQITIVDWNDISVADSAPTSPVLNQLWFDKSITPAALKRWNGSTWISANITPDEYTKMKDSIAKTDTAIDSNGNIITSVQGVYLPSNNNLQAGLNMTADYLGYNDGTGATTGASSWKSYFDKDGNFKFGDGINGPGIVWNQNTGTLGIRGSLKADDITSGGSLSGVHISGGDITIGSGNSIFKADTNGIYLGNSTFGSAPFSVSPSGALTATNATISGKITIGANSSGWTNITDKPSDEKIMNYLIPQGVFNGVPFPNNYRTLYIPCYVDNAVASTNWYKIAEHTFTTSYVPFNFQGSVYWGASGGRFSLKAEVKIMAQTGIDATTLGGLFYAYAGDNPSSVLKVRKSQNASNQWVIGIYAYMGTWTSIQLDGTWVSSSAISWIDDKQGTADAIAGDPGLIDVAPTSNYAMGATKNTGGSGTLAQRNASNPQAGDTFRITGDTIANGNGQLYVYTGSAWVSGADATQVVIDGGIATGGRFEVGTSGLGSCNAGINGSVSGTPSSDIRFWAGSSFANSSTAPFRVQNDGTLIASKGYIGNGSQGWAIGNTSIYNGRSAITTGSGTYIGTDGIALGSTAANPEFKVTSAGALSCRGANISGTLYVEDVVERGNLHNLVSTPTFTSTNKGKWSTAYNVESTGGTTSPNAPPRSYWLVTNTRDTKADDTFQVTPGDILTCSAWMETSSTSYTCHFGVAVYDATGQVGAWLSNVSLAAGKNWTFISGCITIPAGMSYAVPWVQIDGFSNYGYCRISDMCITRNGLIPAGGTISASAIILGDDNSNGYIKTYKYTDSDTDNTPGILLQDDASQPIIKMKSGMIKGARLENATFVGNAPTVDGDTVATIPYVNNAIQGMPTVLKRYQTNASPVLSKQWTTPTVVPTLSAGDNFSLFSVAVPLDTQLTLSGSINASTVTLSTSAITYVFAFQDGICIGVANSCGTTSPIVFEFDCVATKSTSQTYAIVTASNQSNYLINRTDSLGGAGKQVSWAQLAMIPYSSKLNSVTFLNDGTFTVPAGVGTVFVTMTGGGGGGGCVKGWISGAWYWGASGGGGGSTSFGLEIAAAGGGGGIGGTQNNGSDAQALAGAAAAGCYRQVRNVTPGGNYAIKIGRGGKGAKSVTAAGAGGLGYANGASGQNGGSDGGGYNTGLPRPAGGVTTGAAVPITATISTDTYQGHGQPGSYGTDGQDGYCIIEW